MLKEGDKTGVIGQVVQQAGEMEKDSMIGKRIRVDIERDTTHKEFVGEVVSISGTNVVHITNVRDVTTSIPGKDCRDVVFVLGALSSPYMEILD